VIPGGVNGVWVKEGEKVEAEKGIGPISEDRRVLVANNIIFVACPDRSPPHAVRAIEVQNIPKMVLAFLSSIFPPLKTFGPTTLL